MSAPERDPKPPALSMSELLASCSAASAVSTPPRPPERLTEPPAEDEDGRRDAA
ncbi:hypothetical protein [Streptomyces sp. NBC_01304]|uniref:hypothetical protein n=1 Tax=Streptomyces sp. NBC_01304 TaxID=2903818 RepID=UPI002E0F4154|nr:hypothetical protein OG430_20790 [Streptomyces sp. NBC_01304]